MLNCDRPRSDVAERKPLAPSSVAWPEETYRPQPFSTVAVDQRLSLKQAE